MKILLLLLFLNSLPDRVVKYVNLNIYNTNSSAYTFQAIPIEPVHTQLKINTITTYWDGKITRRKIYNQEGYLTSKFKYQDNNIKEFENFFYDDDNMLVKTLREKNQYSFKYKGDSLITVSVNRLNNSGLQRADEWVYIITDSLITYEQKKANGKGSYRGFTHLDAKGNHIEFVLYMDEELIGTEYLTYNEDNKVICKRSEIVKNSLIEIDSFYYDNRGIITSKLSKSKCDKNNQKWEIEKIDFHTKIIQGKDQYIIEFGPRDSFCSKPNERHYLDHNYQPVRKEMFDSEMNLTGVIIHDIEYSN